MYVLFVTIVCVLVVCRIDGCNSVNTESYPPISVGNKSQRHAVIRHSDTSTGSEAVLTREWLSKDMFHVPHSFTPAAIVCTMNAPRHYVYNCWQVVCSTITQHCLILFARK